jgi:isoquinoline 1-oxidoreductase subunit beta
MNSGRRAFLATAAVTGGNLLIGFRLAAATGRAQGGGFAPSAFIRIGKTGDVTLTLPYVEMGQGAYTSQAQLLAEELDVDLDQVRLEHAPANEALYSHSVWGGQITGGSGSLRDSWRSLRQAGASARAMLVAAACEEWRVDAKSCRTERGQVLHSSSGRRINYGELVEGAARLPVPQKVPLKTPDTFRLIGRPVKRVEAPGKVDGSAKFGIDALPPGVVFAVVAASPVFNGKLGAVDERQARAVKGVRQIVKLDDAVAVVADHTWAARKGLAALRIDWKEGANAGVSSAQLIAECDAALEGEGVVANRRGDAGLAERKAAATFEAIYRQPMLAHLAMEPINCTAHVQDGRCEVWVGSQVLGRARKAAAEAAGVPLENVTAHNHLLGGGFGRRLEFDYVTQAVSIAKQVDRPVKVIWSREEDVQHDAFRYHNHSKVRVGLDGGGRPASWRHRVVGPAIMTKFLPQFFKDGVDFDAVNGADGGAYGFPDVLVDYVRREAPEGLRTGNWRGVGHTRNVFVVESVIDELAHRAGRDPVAYRRALLAKSPRALAVLDLAARKAGWEKPLDKGRGRGIAVMDGFGSYLAQVAEVRVGPGGTVRVERVVCAIDCGTAVNPDIVKAQMESGIIYGLSAVLYGRITVANGRIEQSNFHDCPVVRMRDAPRIEVHIVTSGAEPGGVGEPGTSAIQPAVTNAIFNATGKRVRDLPVDPHWLSGR